MKKLVVPKCATEREEAEWWDTHMDIVETNLLEAMKNGTAGKGIVQRLLQRANELAKVTIHLPVADLERARKLCKKRKVDYESYVRTLLHEAIDRDEAALKKPRKKTA
jgi:hypothetical protein